MAERPEGGAGGPLGRAAERRGLARAQADEPEEGLSLLSGEAGRQRRRGCEGEVEADAAEGRAAALGAGADRISVVEEGEAVRAEPTAA